MRNIVAWIGMMACVLALGGCAANGPTTRASDGAVTGLPEDVRRNEGYSLLYKLMGDESGVKDVLVFKHASEPVGGVVKEIAAACGAAKSRMDQFRKDDRGLHYDVANLPATEEKARALAREDQTGKLLGSSGNEFEVRLILSQVQAMGYAAELARAIEGRETNADRKGFLKGLTEQCIGFRERLVKMVTVVG